MIDEEKLVDVLSKSIIKTLEENVKEITKSEFRTKQLVRAILKRALLDYGDYEGYLVVYYTIRLPGGVSGIISREAKRWGAEKIMPRVFLCKDYKTAVRIATLVSKYVYDVKIFKVKDVTPQHLITRQPEFLR